MKYSERLKCLNDYENTSFIKKYIPKLLLICKTVYVYTLVYIPEDRRSSPMAHCNYLSLLTLTITERLSADQAHRFPVHIATSTAPLLFRVLGKIILLVSWPNAHEKFQMLNYSKLFSITTTNISIIIFINYIFEQDFIILICGSDK